MSAWFSGGSPLAWPDYAALALSLARLIAIGLRFTREQQDTAQPWGPAPARGMR